MNVLMLCRTSYQLMTAVRIKLLKHKSDNVDIGLFDTIANVQHLSELIKISGLFKECFLYKIKAYTPAGIRLRINMFTKSIDCKTNKSYEIIYLSNVSFRQCWIENRLIKKLSKSTHKKNKSTSLYMFEDGFSTYSEYSSELFKLLNESRGIKKIICKYLYSEYYKLKGIYVYSPELMLWKPVFEILPIKKVQKDDKEYINMLNVIFGYNSMNDIYDKKIVFFEESYYADGNDIGDVEIVNYIASVVGKENIFIKIHPRNPINRFAELGYKTNRNTVIPWEITAMNEDFSDKTLITIASGSSITSYFMSSNEAGKSILLYDMEGIDKSKLTPTIDVFDAICKKVGYFIYPKTKDELKQILLGKEENDENSSNNANKTE